MKATTQQIFYTKFYIMKKKEGKVLKEKLLLAVKKILKDNNAVLTGKIEKLVNKAVKKIVKNSTEKILNRAKPLMVKSKLN
jgi:hypothetical protein